MSLNHLAHADTTIPDEETIHVVSAIVGAARHNNTKEEAIFLTFESCAGDIIHLRCDRRMVEFLAEELKPAALDILFQRFDTPAPKPGLN